MLKNDEFVSRYTYDVCCLKKSYIINLLLTESAVVTAKYQTSVFYVRTSPSDIFP